MRVEEQIVELARAAGATGVTVVELGNMFALGNKLFQRRIGIMLRQGAYYEQAPDRHSMSSSSSAPL
jgi:hypothetical protein